MGISAAAEQWRTVTWNSTSAFRAEFDALCMESGLTSFDVLETNGYIGSGKRPPATGAELLVPVSKGDLFATWMEVQNRNGGSRPLVTIKPHSIPGVTLGSADQMETPPAVDIIDIPDTPDTPDIPDAPDVLEQAEDGPEEAPVPAEDGEKDNNFRNMRIVVSGDEIVLQRPGDGLKGQILSSLFDSELASQDIIIPNPPVLKPVTRPALGAVPRGKMIWPVDGKVSSGFGRRGRRGHHGIDIPMPNGTPIAAALGGVVADTATNRDRNYRGYGNTVVIDHGNGIVTMYAHCSKLNVRKGQRVRQGEIVGFVGNTGRTTTHHVHFEVRKNGSPVNPIPYLVPR